MNGVGSNGGVAAARLRSRMLEFLKFRVLAAQEEFDADLRDGDGGLDPARIRAWLMAAWPEAAALTDRDLLATLEQARSLYTESGATRTLHPPGLHPH